MPEQLRGTDLVLYSRTECAAAGFTPGRKVRVDDAFRDDLVYLRRLNSRLAAEGPDDGRAVAVGNMVAQLEAIVFPDSE